MKTLPPSSMTKEDLAFVDGVKKAAASAAIELSERDLEAGKRRIYVVVVFEPGLDGRDALGTGIGHPDDMLVVVDAAAVILRTALATLGNDAAVISDSGTKTFS